MNKQVTDNKSANTVQVNALQKQVLELKKITPVTTVKATTTTPAVLTNDQIFQEVSSQFSLVRSNIGFFRIYSQDKVGYSYNVSDVNLWSGYAYKQSGKWNKVVVGGAVQGCSLYSSVPEQYKPVCETSVVSPYTHSDTAYMNSEHGSVNYPPAAMVSYIGS
jgi:hypothetical protein